jgi:two-component system phosphate regulon sensor histidine kinase PhoR
MDDGVLVVSQERRVASLNPAAAHALGLSVDQVRGRKLLEVLRQRPLAEMLERVFATDDVQNCVIALAGRMPRSLVVRGVRLGGDARQGAALVLRDVTHLNRLERVHQDFVANVSHELKTPLAAIHAATETLLDGALNDPEHNVQFLKGIHENSLRLTHLVEDLLVLGRLETGQTAMTVSPLAIGKVVDACVARRQPRAEAKNVALTVAPPAAEVVVRGDASALRRFLDVLLDNAIQFTPAGGQVEVRWKADRGLGGA